MMKTSNVLSPVVMGVLVVLGGCMGGADPATSSSAELASCPPGVAEGMDCFIDPELACVLDTADDSDGEVCRCERFSDDSVAGSVVCSGSTPPGPVYCEEHVRSGERCDPAGPSECRHACDLDISCRCVPASDAADCSYLWLCEDATMPPSPEPRCDDDALRTCLGERYAECVAEDGRACVCEVRPDGEIALSCDPSVRPTPPPADEICTEEHYSRCLSGEYVECTVGPDFPSLGEEGSRCFCDADGMRPDSGLGFYCEPPPPPPPADEICTEEHYSRCLSGEYVECTVGPDFPSLGEEGSRCFCDADGMRPDSGLGFYCEPPTPPMPPTPIGDYCTEEHLLACASGMDVRCERDGRVCSCGATADGRPELICL